MEDYIVSARKYRPMAFDTVIGQDALTTTLKNVVKSGKLAHAYLFCGPRGVGKTTCARIFAKAINCLTPTQDGEACNECESCKAFNNQRSYNIFELDAASNNSVENIKSLMEQTRIPPQVGKYKVFIIDEVHMLSPAAFNAFLKTLEEPPAHVIFILATTEKHKILPTIISRCQIYDFERMTVQNIIKQLKIVAEKENVKYEEQALNIIAEKADGGMRDALSIFDQAASFSQGDITYKKIIEDLNVLDTDYYFNIIDLSIENKVSDIMVLLNSIISKGFDGGNLISGLASHTRNVLMAKDESTLPLLETSEQQCVKYKEQAKKCSTSFLYKALKIMNNCDINYKISSNKRLLTEITLIQIAQITQDDDTPAAGRSPKRLKNLFKNIFVQAQPKPASQVVGAKQPTIINIEKKKVEASISTKEPSSTTKSTSKLATNKFKMSDISITFSNLRKQEDGDSNIERDDNAKIDIEGCTKFSQDELKSEWISMCNRMTSLMPAMAQRLKNMTPIITEYPNIELDIDNQILFDQIENIRGRILVTLAKALRNDKIQINLKLTKPIDIKAPLSKREVFDKMRKENNSIEKLRNLLGLEFT